MTWSCEQTEARLSDYLDGALTAGEQSAFDAHVNACQRCTPLVASVSHLVSGLHGMPQLEAPPRLVYSILDQTLGPRESVAGWRGVLGWVRSIASIRFAYGGLSVVATLAIFVTASGFNWHHPKLADLQPVNIYRNADRKAHLVYARSTKFVSDLRVVNEIQSRVREDAEIPARRESTVPESAPEKQPGRSDGSQPGSRQQNRANGIAREMEVLAMAMPGLGSKRSGAPIAGRLP